MKVFIMWSGERSRTVAIALNRFLEIVVPGPSYFISTEKIEKGEIWDRVIGAALQETTFGIACLTKEAISSSWLHFESGAISRVGPGTSRVIPYLIGIRDADVTGPLTKFQMASGTQDGTRELVVSLNGFRPDPERRHPQSLADTFALAWPALESVIATLPPPKPSHDMKSSPVGQSETDRISRETLERVRELERTLQSMRPLAAAEDNFALDPLPLTVLRFPAHDFNRRTYVDLVASSMRAAPPRSSSGLDFSPLLELLATEPDVLQAMLPTEMLVELHRRGLARRLSPRAYVAQIPKRSLESPGQSG